MYNSFIVKYSLFISLLICLYYNATGQEVAKSKEIEVVQGKKYYIHTVKKGETLYSIAKAYEVTVDAIAYENPDVFNGIKPDQKIRIPIQATPHNKKEHEVQKGETLYGIAKKYGTTIEEIVQLNPDVSKGIQVGQKIIIPVRAETSADYRDEKPKKSSNVNNNIIKHTVKKGETIYGLCKMYGISQEKFYELNPDVKQYGLKEGQEILISTSNQEIVNTPKNQPKTDEKKLEHEQKVLVNKDESVETEINCLSLLAPNRNVKIAFFIPLQNDMLTIENEEATSDPNFKLSPKPYLEFYEGFLMALDSIRRKGLSVDVLLFEARRDSSKIFNILNEKKLEDVDLIIGPFHENIFEIVASWAQKKNIPIINPVSSTNMSLFNYSTVIQLNTTLNSQLDQYIKFIASFDTLNVVIVHSNSNEENQIISLFKRQYLKEFTNNFKTKLPVVKDINYYQVGIDGLEKTLSRSKINLIFIPSQSQTFVINLMTKLNELTKSYKLLLTYMPTWKKFENNFELEHLFNLNMFAFQPFYINYFDDEVKKFVKNYRLFFKTEPSRLSFLGYDTGIYFLSLIQKYGKDFISCINNNNAQTLSTKLYFEKTGKKGGYENKGLYIIRYDNSENTTILTNIITENMLMPLYIQPIEIRKVQKY
jgi:LysM repeat protein